MDPVERSGARAGLDKVKRKLVKKAREVRGGSSQSGREEAGNVPGMYVGSRYSTGRP